MVKSFTRVQVNAVVLFWSSSGKIKFNFGEQVDYLTTEYMATYNNVNYQAIYYCLKGGILFYRVFQKFVPIESCTLYEKRQNSAGSVNKFN